MSLLGCGEASDLAIDPEVEGGDAVDEVQRIALFTPSLGEDDAVWLPCPDGGRNSDLPVCDLWIHHGNPLLLPAEGFRVCCQHRLELGDDLRAFRREVLALERVGLVVVELVFGVVGAARPFD